VTKLARVRKGVTMASFKVRYYPHISWGNQKKNESQTRPANYRQQFESRFPQNEVEMLQIRLLRTAVRHIQHTAFNIIFTVPPRRHGFATRPLHVGISGKQSGTGTCFPPTTSVFPIPSVLLIHISVIWTGAIKTYR
jgi:hypothetical protein